MRLLKLYDNGRLSLIERIGDNVPKYAILSHTWGSDGEEVTYEDLMTGAGEHKPGYDKIKFCGKQAKTDGLQFFWMDTCCIDKRSSAELSTAINSMFRWYRDATRCYVYLSDVPDPQDPASTVESSFPNSRWFKRGWTLQELIAPSSIQFFSRYSECLGSKKSREQQIHQITGIGIEALRGNALSQFSTDERLSWAAKRQTTVEEDAAYCLLGIFDIQMPLIYGEGRQKALDRLQRKIRKSLGAPIVPKQAAWIVPFERNPRFTGRKHQLAQLEGMLFAKDHTAKAAVMGLGGVGKTQLTLELLFQTKDKHPDFSIIWIPATNKESLHLGYLDAAQQLGIPGWKDDKEDLKRLVHGYLGKESTGRWLLVFDNADDIDMWIAKAGSGLQAGQGSRPLIDYLPKSKQGAILFTTRDRRLAVKLAQQNVVEVPAMGEDAAARLLEKCLVNPKLVNSRQDTSALLSQLTYLPLAIVQAAAYINENGIAIADCLSLLLDQEEEVIDVLSEEFEDDGRYRDVKNPVATTWLISFEQIRRRDPLAAEYLSFMACVEPKDIPQSLLPPGPTRKKEIDAIGTLDAYSFIIRRPMDMALDLHRLVHLATRNWLRKEEQLSQSTEKAIMRLEEVFPNDSHENRSLWRTYLTHVRYVIESDLVDKSWETRMDLMWRYAMCLYQDGRWDEAEISITQVLDIEKRILGADHPDTLTSMANLASTYRNQGRWEAAEELEVQVMETRKKKLGADHPDTLTSIANLASTFWNQGRWEAAEDLDVQVVETRKKKLGADHPDTLTSMANLASTFWNQGRWEAAEELDVQVVETRKKKLGADHPDTLTSIANLASTYRNQGRWEAAEELDVQVMETRKKKLGADHPDTLTSMNNLASTFWNQGRWEAAEDLDVQVVETRKKKLGADHPDTLTSMANLASTFWNQGRWEAAEELEVQVIEMSKKKLGADHPSTLTSIANLASTYRNQGRWEAAEELDAQVMETRKRKLGADHPSTLTSMANLASTYRNQGRWEAAEELDVQVVETRKKKLGADHPDTLTSIANLASTFWNQGRWEAAEELEVQVMETRKKKLGADHPDTLTSMANLASTFWNQGQWEAAEELEVQVMETRKKKLGADHPDTLTSMNNLAFTWKGQGRIVKATRLMGECVQRRQRVLGANHPNFISSSRVLAEWEA